MHTATGLLRGCTSSSTPFSRAEEKMKYCVGSELGQNIRFFVNDSLPGTIAEELREVAAPRVSLVSRRRCR